MRNCGLVRLHSVDPNFQFIPPSYSPSAGFYLQKKMQAELFFSFFSVFKVLLLNISKTYSDSDCWETNLRVSPFKGDQHHAYHPNGPRTACNLLWVCLFLGVLGKFYRNRKGLSIFKVIGIGHF